MGNVDDSLTYLLKELPKFRKKAEKLGHCLKRWEIAYVDVLEWRANTVCITCKAPASVHYRDCSASGSEIRDFGYAFGYECSFIVEATMGSDLADVLEPIELEDKDADERGPQATALAALTEEGEED